MSPFSCYHPYSLAENQTVTSVRGKRSCIFFLKQHQHHDKIWSPLLKKHMVQDHLSSSLQLPLCSLDISLFMLSGFLIHILKSSSITAFWFTKCLWRPGRCFTKVRSRTCDLCFRPKALQRQYKQEGRAVVNIKIIALDWNWLFSFVCMGKKGALPQVETFGTELVWLMFEIKDRRKESLEGDTRFMLRVFCGFPQYHDDDNMCSVPCSLPKNC